jgi:hypothetical protein
MEMIGEETEMLLTDDAFMTDGLYKGLRMKDVPAVYLLHLPKAVTNPALKKYISQNLDVLRIEEERQKRLQSQQRPWRL